MEFKVHARVAEQVAMGGMASALAYVPAPVVIGVALLSDSIRWGWALGGFAVLAVLLSLNVADLRAAGRHDMGWFRPELALLELLLSIVALSLMLMAVPSHAPLLAAAYLLPMLSVSVVGDRRFIVIVWLSMVAALSAVLVGIGLPAAEVARVTVVHGALWVGAALVIDFALHEAESSIAASAALAELATVGSRLTRWPDDLAKVANVVARAGNVDRFLLFASPPAARADDAPVEVFRWGTAWTDDEVAQATSAAYRVAVRDGERPRVRERGMFVARCARRDERWLVLVAPGRTVRRTLTEPERILTIVEVLDYLADRARHLQGLRDQALTDPLTGLGNRRLLRGELGRRCSAARRSGSPLAVAMVDIDHFKAYNDSFGHGAGDEALQLVAELLNRRTRREDLAARYGGEEFALVFPDLNLKSAVAVSEGLRVALAEVRPNGLTISVGVAEWDGVEPPEGLLARADAALYEAKAQGRDRVVPDDTVTT